MSLFSLSLIGFYYIRMLIKYFNNTEKPEKFTKKKNPLNSNIRMLEVNVEYYKYWKL